MKTLNLALITLAFLLVFSAHAEPLTVTGAVAYVSEDHGNVDTDISLATLTASGINKGDLFTVTHGDRSFDVYMGDTYSDVPKGDFVGFINSAGTLRIARNFDDAAAALGVAVGDSLTVSK